MDETTAEELRSAARANGVTDWETLENYISAGDEDAARGLIWEAAEDDADEEALGRLTPAEAARLMREIPTTRGDEADHHRSADDLLTRILRQHGYDEAAEAFDNMTKWYE